MDKKQLYINIFNEFRLNFNNCIFDMHNITHSGHFQDINPYHMENDVWAHTVASYTYLQNLFHNKDISNLDFIILALSILFHDVGKPYSVQLSKKGYRCFYNHEEYSVRFIIEHLNILKNMVSNILSLMDDDEKNNCNFNDIILFVMLLVNLHNKFYMFVKNNDKHITEKICKYLNYNKKLINVFKYLIYADSWGSISLVRNEINFDVLDDCVDYEIERNADVNFIVLVGLPASGKDTYANREVQKNNGIILSYDDIRIDEYKKNVGKNINNMSYNEMYNEAWLYCRNKNIKLDQILFNKLYNAIENGYKYVYISNTNVHKKARNKIKHIIKQAMISLNKNNDTNIMFNISCFCNIISPYVCVERDKNRDKMVGRDVIFSMHNLFTLPTFIEEWNKIDYVFY